MRFAIFLALAAASAGPAAAEVITGDWSLEPTADPAVSRLTLHRPEVIVGGRYLLSVAAELDTLPAAVWNTAGVPVAWTLTRDAGSIRFEGASETGRLAGRFRFSADPRFVSAIKGTVYNWWDTASLLDLAVRGVSFAFAGSQREAGVSGISAAALARRFENARLEAPRAEGDVPERASTQPLMTPQAKPRGASALTPEALATLRSLGISRAYYESLQQSGYAIFPEDAARLGAQGVSADLVRQMKLSGHDAFNANDLIRLQNYGVTPHDVRTYELQTGRSYLSADEIVRFKTNGIRGR
jgi:hypothetical protein